MLAPRQLPGSPEVRKACGKAGKKEPGAPHTAPCAEHPVLCTACCAPSTLRYPPHTPHCTARPLHDSVHRAPCIPHAPSTPRRSVHRPLCTVHLAPSALHATHLAPSAARGAPNARCYRAPSAAQRGAAAGGHGAGPGAGAHSAPAVPIPPHSPGPPPPPARSGARRGDVTRTRGRDPRPTAHAPRGRHRGRARLCGGVTRHACARSGAACARDTRVPHGQPLPGRGPQRAPRLPAPCPRRCNR